MTPRWSSGPPAHERGLSSREQETRDQSDPDYDSCVILKKYDMRKQEVWFSAQEGQTVVGRSRAVAHRRTFLGDLKRFDRDLEAAYDSLVETLLRSGWEPLGGDQEEPPKAFRIRKKPPAAGTPR
jgi:hypothetical protein